LFEQRAARQLAKRHEDTPMPAERELGGGIPDDVHSEIPIGWTPKDYDELLLSFAPYINWIERFLASNADLPSHIPNSGSIAVPIGESTTPEALFAALGPNVRFEKRDYPEFWITIHYPNPEPVVTLLPKRLPGIPAKVEALCADCSRALGKRVGDHDGMFLAWLLPGFSWAMHTDHDNAYELTDARVHIPLITSPAALYVWGRKDQAGNEEWLLTKHLEPNKAHYVRVDVPHTVVNKDPEKPRLHLILDIH
jgi:hypothetical protein